MSDQTRYRIAKVVRGGAKRRVRGSEARAKIARELHGQVVSAGDVAGRVPEQFANWWYDLRRKQNAVYGSLLRYIDIQVMLGTPKHVLKTIPGMVDAYIDDQYDDQGAA